MTGGLSWLVNVSKPNLLRGVGAGLIMMLASLLSFAYPLASQYLIDTVLPGGNVQHLSWFVLGLIVLYGAQSAITFFGSYLSSSFGQRVMRDVQLQIFSHTLTLQYEAFNQLRFGDVTSRVISDVAGIRSLLADNFLHLLKDLLTFFIGVVILLWFNAQLGLVAMPWLILLVFVAHILSNRARRSVKAVQEQIGALTTSFLDPIYNFLIVKVYSLQDLMLTKARTVANGYISKRIRLDLLNASNAQSSFFVTSVGTLFILWYGGQSLFQGEITLGHLLAFSFLFSQLAGITQRLASYGFQFKGSLACLDRLEELRMLPVETVESTGDPPVEGAIGGLSIEFKDVVYSYPNGRRAASNVRFSVPEGSTVALVGPNGAGKSTLVKLLLKLYEIQDGDILVHGRSIKEEHPSRIRSIISFVPQEDFLFPMSIEENIRLGKSNATREEVVEAARAARAHEFITQLPEGYAANLSERGANLSGGERQRISIARAFLKNSPILVLDEAVSQIDAVSDALIRAAMDNLSENRTVIIIAHRLSTVLRADQIVVLNGGCVEATGTHADLYTSCPLYRQLCDDQTIIIPERRIEETVCD